MVVGGGRKEERNWEIERGERSERGEEGVVGKRERGLGDMVKGVREQP